MAYMPSNETIEYLSKWLNTSTRYQNSKGRQVNLTMSDLLTLWGTRRLKKLDEWVAAGMSDARMNKHNPYAYVLSWQSREACATGIMDINTAKVMTRLESERMGRFSKGDRHDDAAKERIGAAKRGKPQSEEQKRKRSEAQKGIKRGPMSEETKAKIRAAKALKKNQ